MLFCQPAQPDSPGSDEARCVRLVGRPDIVGRSKVWLNLEQNILTLDTNLMVSFVDDHFHNLGLGFETSSSNFSSTYL